MKPEVDLQRRIADLEEMYKRQTKELDSLKAEITDLKKCVQWYADKENWTLIRDRESPSGFFYSCTGDSDEEPFNPKDEDDDRVIGGKLARECLRKWGK